MNQHSLQTCELQGSQHDGLWPFFHSHQRHLSSLDPIDLCHGLSVPFFPHQGMSLWWHNPEVQLCHKIPPEAHQMWQGYGQQRFLLIYQSLWSLFLNPEVVTGTMDFRETLVKSLIRIHPRYHYQWKERPNLGWIVSEDGASVQRGIPDFDKALAMLYPEPASEVNFSFDTLFNKTYARISGNWMDLIGGIVSYQVSSKIVTCCLWCKSTLFSLNSNLLPMLILLYLHM